MNHFVLCYNNKLKFVYMLKGLVSDLLYKLKGLFSDFFVQVKGTSFRLKRWKEGTEERDCPSV